MKKRHKTYRFIWITRNAYSLLEVFDSVALELLQPVGGKEREKLAWRGVVFRGGNKPSWFDRMISTEGQIIMPVDLVGSVIEFYNTLNDLTGVHFVDLL